MPVHNADIGTIFEEIAELPEIENANPFRVALRVAHRRVASASCHRANDVRDVRCNSL
jgi:DNA polymerase/3'-5' exonuclease PolX